MCYNIRKVKENPMSEALTEVKKHALGAEYFIPKTREEIRKDLATQELESRNKRKGATNGSKEDNKEM